ncbi:uncharacterized protein LOC143516422 isoform X3 [Brachyhypopomus gauderio]|uniref:uncharacterized protein LOC143516422 isoform X3 n=1 Tax=Brachyhypopomus gauderio TaxID=698409 RepID=UPI0040432B47
MQLRTVEQQLYSNILPVKMDFDNQKIKECQLPSKKPPIKPRRSIKIRATTREDAGQSGSQANQKENEVVVKRIAPSHLLFPHGPLEAQTPSLRAHILLWFQTTQLPRLHTHGSSLPCWLHGFATRREAEQLLQDKQQGCFLLRLSESKVGFVLSYRGADRCRHFIIEEESKVSGMNGQYIIAGEQSRHESLEELIEYYTHNPVGPFNETLTTPCVQEPVSRNRIHPPSQFNSNCEEVKLGEADEGPEDRRPEDTGGQGTEGQRTWDKGTEDTGEALQLSLEHPTTGPTHEAAGSAQYAVVRKVLRKTHSLPECKIVTQGKIDPDLALPVKDVVKYAATTENDVQEHVVGSPTLDIADLSLPVDAPYARVNKPPRVVVQNPSVSDTHPSSQRVAAVITPQSFASAASVVEQKYWELEPLHTYEETLHTRSADEEIDFYAVGRRQKIAGDPSVHHLYSEVNIKGTRDHMAMQAPPSLRMPRPNLPHRPPLRSPNACSHPENSIQISGSAAGTSAPFNPSEQLLAASSAFSIYEQIPERPSNSRPPCLPIAPKAKPRSSTHKPQH